MVELKIDLSSRKFYLFFLLIVVLALAGVSYAYNSNWKTVPGNPAVVGHSPDELAADCEEGQVLKVSGGKWVCADVANVFGLYGICAQHV